MQNYSQLNSQTKRVVFPYSLSANGHSSASFYARLGLFASDVEEKATSVFGKYLTMLACANQSEMRNDMLLNILICACMWEQYRGKWGRFIAPKHKVLNGLYRLRKKYPHLKPPADRVRGYLISKWLTSPVDVDMKMGRHTLHKLSLWLNATGDFREESIAVKQLSDKLNIIPLDFHDHFFGHMEAFAAWFKKMAKTELGNYTSNVQPFIKYNAHRYKGKENYFFCGSNELQYHLNMVGAAWMNKWLKPGFENARNKILLLPACMASGASCKAKKTDRALLCTHCTANCNVSVTAGQLEISGVKTLLIKHSSDFSEWLKPWANQQHTALIGTACVLNLLQGGFGMKRLGIPSQCVFLDYSACKKHWHKSGIPTKMDVAQAELLVSNNTSHSPKPLSTEALKSILLSFN